MGTTVTGDVDVAAIATRQEFAEALTAVRERAGLTVREVARRAGIRASTVGGYYSGRHLPPLRPDGGVRSILAACGVLDPAELDAWQRTLARIRRAPGPRPGGLPAPWVGLRPYGPADVAAFHGRDEETRALLALVLVGGLVAVVGDAGSGKSSLLGAGLLPGLARDGDGRPVAVLTPGPYPLRALAVALAGLAPAQPDVVLARLRDAPTAVRDLDLPARAVIVVDQLEELFAAGIGEGERAAFVAALAAACRPSAAGPGPATVVVALRSRFLSQAARYPDLMRALRPGPGSGSGAQEGSWSGAAAAGAAGAGTAAARAGAAGVGGAGPLLLAAMTPDRLRAVLLGPARAAGLGALDEEFVRRVLTDAAATPDPLLPRLSHALARAWQERLRLDTGEDVGTARLADSVHDTAEAAYGALSPAARRAARHLLVRLHVVTPGGVLPTPALAPALLRTAPVPGAGSGGAGDPAGSGQAVDAGAGADAVDEAVRGLVAAGLLVGDGDGVRAATGCLPQLWYRLAGWLEHPEHPEQPEDPADPDGAADLVLDLRDHREPPSAAGTPAATDAAATGTAPRHREPEGGTIRSAAPTGPAVAAPTDWWVWRWAFVAALIALLVVAGVAHELWR